MTNTSCSGRSDQDSMTMPVGMLETEGGGKDDT